MTVTYDAAMRAAYNTAVLRFNGARGEQGIEKMQSANAFLFLVMDERKNGKRDPYHKRVLAHLKNILKGGNEPCIDAVQYWSYPAVVCAITLCKVTPEIWIELTEDEIARADFLMTAFALMSNFISNDSNNYKTGIGLKGDVWKERTANFKFPFVTPIVAAAHYFGGADAVDELLVGFDYDSFITKAQTFGFKNLLEIWTTPGFEDDGVTYPGAKELLCEAGKAYIVSAASYDHGNVYRGGEGMGVKIPYIYQGFRADDVGIVNYLLEYNHSGGAAVSRMGDEGDGTFTCYTLDGSDSSVEGKDGMMIEYNMSDPGGLRSDARYCMMDFNMEIALLCLVSELGLWTVGENSELYDKIYVGNTDHVHKLEVGYKSKGMGIRKIEQEHNLVGYYFTKALWEKYFPVVEV